MNTDILVVIPARGGSKGIPRKNIKELAGKPLINYTIENARQLFEDKFICVSTDDIEIKRIVEKSGLRVPFLRPDYLASDSANTQDVLRHAINHYETYLNLEINIVILLQPTSPLRKNFHIIEALSLFDTDIDMVVSVKETKSNPYFTLYERSNDGLLSISKDSNFTRRQDCPFVYELNGSIYIFNASSLKSKKISEFRKIKGYIMGKEYSVDIDDDLDWAFAELLLKKTTIDSDESGKYFN